MKIALLGYGKMGKAVEKAAARRNHSICQKNGEDCDLFIDFSHASVILDHIDLCIAAKKPLVIGTTGWYEHLEQVKQKVASSGIGVLYSANFSLGVNLFARVVQEASKLLHPFENYDVAGFELHHNQKSDTPSGTAQVLAEKILQHFPRKKRTLYTCENRKIEKEELQFTSLRLGGQVGTHSVIFDSEQDSITLTHTAKNRDGFAEGAVIGAEWLLGKKGFYSIDDLLDDL